ncbi:hypothetical protein BDA96_02G221400 [Sorghum bicolor]|uniref:Uncharacterized protein n=2 Tax=Sorghum bicolor TaxID=4558 RepID=A0A921RPH8_SORBI|nr:hypothetical protein BDA96_02G221400 [Sorghum bicolor]KXG35678.1 hypothetical protein SORBI_3002G210800 [Sorghum bicolor]
MEAARRKPAPAAAAMALTLLMIVTLVASSGRGTVVAAARLQGEGGHHVSVSESIPPTVAEGKYAAGSSKCTHDPNKPKTGPCPHE